MKWMMFLVILILSITVVAAECTVDLKVDKPKTTYKPYDYVNLTAKGGFVGEGSVIFYVINPQNQEVGRSQSIGMNASGHASTYFMVGNGWAKGTYRIKVDYSRGACSTSKIVEVYLDTFTVPVDMKIEANLSLSHISQCQNITSGNITYQICLTGEVPTGFDWKIKDINTTQMLKELGNITIEPTRTHYPFEFVKDLQDRMTDCIWQKNQIIDSNSRLSSNVLNLSQQNTELSNQLLSAQQGQIQQQLTYWQNTATMCWNDKNESLFQVSSQARSKGFWAGAITFLFVGLFGGVGILVLFVWLRSRGDELGGSRY